MVTIQIEDTDAPKSVEENDDCIEKHELEVSEKVGDPKEEAQEIIDSTAQELEVSETTLLKTEEDNIQPPDESESEINTKNGYEHSMKNFFNNLSEAQNDDCSPDDLSISFDGDPLMSEDKTEPGSEKDSSSMCLTFSDLANTNCTEPSQGTTSKTDPRKQKYLIEDDEAFETARVEESSVSNEEEFTNIDPAFDYEKVDKDKPELSEESDMNMGNKNSAFDPSE